MELNKPIYVLHANEGALMPSGEKAKPGIIQIAIWCVLGVLLLGSLMFGEILFFEMNWSSQILLVILVVRFGFPKQKEVMMPSPMELRFYSDYLEIYRPSLYYDSRTTRKEYRRMKYADITKCSYKTRAKRIHIRGKGTSIFYVRAKDGTFPAEPTKIKNFDDGMFFFNTSMDTVDFKKEIEEHSPIRVIDEEY